MATRKRLVKRQVKDLEVKRGVFRVFGFSVLSPLYPYYWFFVARQQVTEQLKTHDNVGLQTVGLIVPILNIFILYWLYRDIQRLREQEKLTGFSAGGYTAFLVVAFLLAWVPIIGFALAIGVLIVYGLVIQKLNEYWDKRTNWKAKNAPVKGGEVAIIIGGFVLFWILIVMMALVLAALSSAQKGSRDSQRRSELNQIKTALVLYQADTGKYPIQPSPSMVTNFSEPSRSLVPNYLTAALTDPLDGRAYYYVSDGNNFGVCADSERNSVNHFQAGSLTSTQNAPGPASSCRILP